ncbi:J domain-containing protein [Bradyrhizobium roseum]|uniref:J domain-containing protein n=1 Tax=Bradyrhizobium roseum TaxID=3056648 RepID=UPI0026314409|nr:J domain-containing protein [Bradyrhizobium roseus]WKA26918.1 J domain-containing protein [Bradyrhizobium roseus]
MGTLYDMLGALPSDDAEELRTAFRKAAKATHPDTNPDNPEAAVRFRELMRAYDILNDPDQRATYDHLLAIALQPSANLPSTRTYETVRKVASNTMAASVILAVLVGGYTVFGLFSKAPSAAEMVAGLTAGGNLEVAAVHPAAPAQEEPQARREADIATGSVTAAAAPAAKEAGPAPVGRLERVPAFVSYDLGIQYYPRFAAAYFDRGAAPPYRMGTFDRPLTDVTAARRAPDSKRSRIASPLPSRPLMIVPVVLERRVPERREPVTAALTP